MVHNSYGLAPHSGQCRRSGYDCQIFARVRRGADILLTTRLQALGTIAQSVEVKTMEQEEGITLSFTPYQGNCT